MLKLYILLGLFFVGCAGTPTKDALGPATFINKPAIANSKKHITIEFRTYWTHKFTEHESYSIRYDEDLAKLVYEKISQAIANENVSVTELKNDFKHLSFTGKDYENINKKIIATSFPLKSDYLIQLEFYSEGGIHDGTPYMYWGILHILTLGLIPLTIPQNDNIKTTLFSKDGKILQQKETINSGRIWYWTPLFFFNGFSMFASDQDIRSPMIGNSIEHAISDLDYKTKK